MPGLLSYDTFRTSSSNETKGWPGPLRKSCGACLQLSTRHRNLFPCHSCLFPKTMPDYCLGVCA